CAARGGGCGVEGGAAPAGRARDGGEQLVARPADEQLQLTMLVDRTERGDRRGALAVLAEAFGPKLNIPAGEALEAVRIGHQHRYRLPPVPRERHADGP